MTCDAARFVVPNQIPADIVYLAKVGRCRRITGPDALQVVVEMRQVDERQRRIEPCVDLFGRFGNPLRRSNRRSRPPEFKQRKRPERRLQLVAQRWRRRVDVGDLSAVGRIHRPRRHGVLRRGVHVEPPEQVRARERRIGGARRLPDLRRLHELVGLLPEPHLGVVALVPAVADDAVRVREAASDVVGLCGAGHGRKRRLDRGPWRPRAPSRTARASMRRAAWASARRR